jgi:hypothetical protein
MKETGRRCEHCGHTVGDSGAFCPWCGEATAAQMIARAGDGDLYLPLVTANVLRLRRQWTAAEAKCSDVLRRDPGNAAACSVMGDILRDQGNLRDAIEWYKMALDRDPASDSDRKKLESLIDRVFSGRPQALTDKVRSAVGRGLAAAGAEVRADRPPAPIALILGIVLGAILVVAVATIVLGRSGAGQLPPAPVPTPSGSFQDPYAPEGGTLLPAEAGDEDKPPSASGSPEVDEDLAADLAAREQELLETLQAESRVADPNCQVLAVEIDPRAGSLSVHVSMPRLWSPATTRGEILRAALMVAANAVAWDPRLSRLRVRCDMRQPDGARELAMLAEGSAEEVAKFPDGAAAGAEEAFHSVWWHPDLREANETGSRP